MNFQANGRLWVWERGGRVWIVDEANPVTTPVIDIRPEVGAWSDHGLLGFALHPDFETTGYVYLLFVVDRHHLLNCDSPQVGEPVCGASYSAVTNEYTQATIGRIVRYRAVIPAGQSDYRNARAIDYSTRRTLLGDTFRGQPKNTGCPIVHSSHGVGTLLFGMDGTLLATCGDGASFNSTDVGSASESYYIAALDNGIIDSAQNVGAFRSQLLSSHSGKILRLDPDTGNGLASNPFFESAAPRSARSRVWALGARNPFRMTIRPLSGSHNPSVGNPGVLYLGDVGWNTWEDMHVVRSGGENLGWPLFEGLTAHGGYTSADTQNLSAPNPLFGGSCAFQFFRFKDLLKQDTLNTPSWPNPCNSSQQITSADLFLHSRPAIEWRHGTTQARWAAFDSGGNAITPAVGTSANGEIVTGTQFSGSSSQGGTWYTGTDFPEEYRNTYFHGDYSGQWIRNFVFDSNNELREVREFLSAGGGIVDMATHPITGGLYYNSWTAYVRKVSYSPTGNVPPIAAATATPTYGSTPLIVQFNALASTDANNDVLTYQWNFGDGTAGSTSGNPTHTYNAPAGQVTNYNATVTVRDPGGLTSQTTLLISVNNTPPSVNITSPVDGSQYSIGGGNVQLALNAQISDQQTPSAQLSCQWLIILHHNTHQHEEPVINSCAANYTLQPVGCDGETYFFSAALTVTDSSGLSTTDESRIYPACGSNAPPTTAADTATVAFGSNVAVNVLANDSDSDGLNPATVRIIALPASGSISSINPATGAITYQHNGAVVATDSFTYVVDDSQGAVSAPRRYRSASRGAGGNDTVIRVNAGGPNYTDAQGRVWSADYGFNTGRISSVTNAIAGTADPALYRKTRWDDSTNPELGYSFAVPNGTYSVSLHFAETWTGGQGVGLRVFDVLLEGALVIDNFDIFSEAGGYRALIKTFPVTVTDGQLNIGFAHGSADDPTIGAIEILGSERWRWRWRHAAADGAAEPDGTGHQRHAGEPELGGIDGQWRRCRRRLSYLPRWRGAYDQSDELVCGHWRDRRARSTAYRVAAFDNAAPSNESAQSASCQCHNAGGQQQHGDSSEYRRAELHRYTRTGVGGRLWIQHWNCLDGDQRHRRHGRSGVVPQYALGQFDQSGTGLQLRGAERHLLGQSALCGDLDGRPGSGAAGVRCAPGRGAGDRQLRHLQRSRWLSGVDQDLPGDRDGWATEYRFCPRLGGRSDDWRHRDSGHERWRWRWRHAAADSAAEPDGTGHQRHAGEPELGGIDGQWRRCRRRLSYLPRRRGDRDRPRRPPTQTPV